MNETVITVALPGLDVLGIEMIQEIEEALDASLVSLGFSRAETTKSGEAATLKYRRFGFPQ